MQHYFLREEQHASEKLCSGRNELKQKTQFILRYSARKNLHDCGCRQGSLCLCSKTEDSARDAMLTAIDRIVRCESGRHPPRHDTGIGKGFTDVADSCRTLPNLLTYFQRKQTLSVRTSYHPAVHHRSLMRSVIKTLMRPSIILASQESSDIEQNFGCHTRLVYNSNAHLILSSTQ